jgi:hypothetical protein
MPTPSSNPGQLPGTQLAYATAALPTCCNLDGWNYVGDVTDDAQASPPSNVFFDNQSALNEAIIQFEVEDDTVLAFSFSISGPAVDAPNGTSSSGTTFSIGPNDTGPNGVLGLVNLNLNGTGTIETFSPDITITALNPQPPPPSVPEPSTLSLLATGLTAAALAIRFKLQDGECVRCFEVCNGDGARAGFKPPMSIPTPPRPRQNSRAQNLL